MDDATALKLGGGIFLVTNWVLTNITSKKVGLRGDEGTVSGEDEHRAMSNGGGSGLPLPATEEVVQYERQTSRNPMEDGRSNIPSQ